MVLGDTAFDAEAVRTACEERKFSWIVPINPERVLAGAKPRPKVSSLSEILTADQMVCLQVHPGKGKYVDYRRISRYRIGPKFKPRTYYVHEESRDVHSVGMVRLFFSTTKAPAQGHRVEVQKILMTNDEKLTLRDVIESTSCGGRLSCSSKSSNPHWDCITTASRSSRRRKLGSRSAW